MSTKNPIVRRELYFLFVFQGVDRASWCSFGNRFSTTVADDLLDDLECKAPG